MPAGRQGVALAALAADHLAPRVAIIDIGSNSVRLVVYRGLSRAPAILFNEKVMAGLGRGLATGRRLSETSMEAAVAAVARFALLAEAMAVDSLRAVATAAVREAVNGPEFAARVERETGVRMEIIDGETEARCAAFGVIAGIPEADGIVGDLGGGSLELVRVAGGEAFDRVSLPLGTLKLDAMRRKSPRAFTKQIDRMLDGVEWIARARGRPFYAVGGSWRGLAHLHMHLTGWPLPVIHHYVMPADAPQRLVRTLSHIDIKALREVPAISSARAPQLMGAALLMKAVTRHLASTTIIASAYGLREGLLFLALPDAARHEDPLLSVAREEAQRSGRFSDGSDAAAAEALLAFADPLFPDDSPPARRLRHAACLLADAAWRAHPDMRAEHGLDLALHGNWVGIDGAERATLAMALFVANGGAAPDAETAARLQRLAPPAALARARLWGLAIRLGQRLAGGSADLLGRARIRRDARALVLSLQRDLGPLYGESVRRRHRLLAQALALEPVLRLLTPGELQALAS